LGQVKFQNYKQVIINFLYKIIKFIPIIGIIFFVYLLIDIGIDKIIEVFLSIPIIFLFIAFLLVILRLILSSFKWWFISINQKIDISLFKIFKILLICFFYESITPVSIGSFIGVFYIKKEGRISWQKSFTNSLLDNAIDFIIMMVLALIGSLFIFNYYPEIFYILFFIFMIIIILFFFLMKEKRGYWLFNYFIKPLFPLKIREKIGKSIELLYEDIPSFKDMIFPFLIGLCVWIIFALQVYTIAYALSIDIPIISFIFIYYISSIAGLLPLSVGGIGLREGTLVFLLLIFGVPPATTFVISLCSHIIGNIFPGFLGGLLLIRETYFDKK
jgi:uncharacterized protein (TIRG00374 family)